MASLEGHRDGATYEAEFDYTRLNKQAHDVFTVMRDGLWHSLASVAWITGHPEASVSARLRDLRKPRFGKHTVERKRHPLLPGLYLYRLTRAEAEAA